MDHCLAYHVLDLLRRAAQSLDRLLKDRDNDLCSFSSWEESYHTSPCGVCPVPVLAILHRCSPECSAARTIRESLRARYGRRGYYTYLYPWPRHRYIVAYG